MRVRREQRLVSSRSKLWLKVRSSHSSSVAAGWVQTCRLTRKELSKLETATRRRVKKLPPLQRSVWKRCLLDDGDIESNPRPSSSRRCINVVSIHTNGRRHAWSVLKLAGLQQWDVVVMQDTRVSPQQQGSFERSAQGKGYLAWCLPSTKRGKLWYHGLIMLTKRNIRVRQICSCIQKQEGSF